MFELNNKDTRCQWRRSGIFIVNFEYVIAGWDVSYGIYRKVSLPNEAKY